MQTGGAGPFRTRRFPEEIIVLCIWWYLRYRLTCRDLEEIMAERGLFRKFAQVVIKRLRSVSGVGL
jgi:transposase-like protein